ncbi:MAG TPA: hypothetical protein VHC42_04075 [Rhizomicrobium sp.]|nr:hypothetical protein [Rhizomicrobium sp.]
MSALPLSRRYRCVLGAPTLDAVDPDIFVLRYFARCMACGFCADQCCSYGVDIDAANALALKDLGADFEAFVGAPREGWFADETFEDPEFPSGRYTRTQVRGGHCVFHDNVGRGCRIHAYCLERGLDYRRYKPLVSILFPLTFDHGRLGPSSEAVDGSLVCSGDGPSLYDGGRAELAYFFGEALVAELDGLCEALTTRSGPTRGACDEGVAPASRYKARTR